MAFRFRYDVGSRTTVLVLAAILSLFAGSQGLNSEDRPSGSQRQTEAKKQRQERARELAKQQAEQLREQQRQQREKERENNRPTPGTPVSGSYVVLGYNDLGMHCMNQDFSQMCILPPFNNLHAQVVRRGDEPQIVTRGVEVNYRIPGNTTSITKTNFWLFAPTIFNLSGPLAPDVGLTGNGLSGSMKPTGNNDWAATGIPITPLNDKFELNPYPLAEIKVVSANQTLATTHAVVPVSWEISCNLCHAPGSPGAVVERDILNKHDGKFGTQLALNADNGQPALCAACHADPALGTPGVPGVSAFSAAMHGSHASRMAALPNLKNSCYACHPGIVTNCQRDIHFIKGIYCTQCHGDMAAVGDPSRTAWVSEPTCGSCHKKMQPEFDFEEPGKLFKESRGHKGIHCAACHGSPHAIGPAVTDADNQQAIERQGFAGTIQKCTVCHATQPHGKFEHHFGD